MLLLLVTHEYFEKYFLVMMDYLFLAQWNEKWLNDCYVIESAKLQRNGYVVGR